MSYLINRLLDPGPNWEKTSSGPFKAGKLGYRPPRDNRGVTCFRCGKPGHIAQECQPRPDTWLQVQHQAVS